VVVLTLVLFLFVAVIQSQTPIPEPEHKKLGVWIGKWKIEGEAKQNPIFPEGKYYATMTCEWLDGGFHVFSHTKWTGAMGPYTEYLILGYDNADKTFYGYDFESFGGKTVFMGTLKENVFIYMADFIFEGKPVAYRWTVTDVKPGEISWTSELSIEGAPWALIGESKAVRE
jgi:hypothetical protein